TLRQRFPFVATCSATINAQPTAGWIMLGVALDRHDINRFRLMPLHAEGKTKITRQIVAGFAPRIARIVGSHHVPMFLHVQRARTRWMHRDAMHAVTDFGRSEE